jgi:ATP-dependent RNA helicase DDX56/DBP9
MTDLMRKTLSLASLESSVIDEANLILSCGDDQDIRQNFVGSFLPKVFQSFLMSATMMEDADARGSCIVETSTLYTHSIQSLP